MRPCLKRGGSAAARLPLALLVAAHSATLASTAADPADPPPPTTPTNRTVMAWIAGNSTTSLRFILHGAAKGTVNAISTGGMFGFATNKTDAWLTVDAQAVAAHRRVWQQGEPKAAGLRTYPSMNLNWDIVGLRTLVKPRVQRRFIDDLVSAIEATDVVRLPALHPPPTRTMHHLIVVA